MVLNYVLVGCPWPVCPCKWMANNLWVSTYWICLTSLVCLRADVKEIGDVCTQAKSCLHISNFWLTQLVQRRATKLIIKDRPYGERLQEPNLLSLASRRLFMDSAFLFKCMMGLTWFGSLSYYLVTADNYNYNLRHANYQFKTRTDVLKFSYFFRQSSRIMELSAFKCKKNWIFKRF